jgi:hypothetical protein
VLFDLTAAVPTHWRLDVADRTVHRGTAIGTWAGDVSTWEFDADEGDRTSTFAMSGSDQGENVVLWDGIDQFAATVRLGAGPDELYANGKAEEPGTYALGRDRDTLHVTPGGATSDLLPGVHVKVDLVAGRLDYGPGPAAPAIGISGVEDVSVAGTRVRVLGDRLANAITVDGCDAGVRAGGGADDVSVVVVPYYGAASCSHTSRVEGGPGADKLSGADKSTDVLLGGRGRDFADGGAGVDTCRAEVTRNCEQS